MVTKKAKNILINIIERVNQWQGTGITFCEICHVYACKIYPEKTKTFFPDYK